MEVQKDRSIYVFESEENKVNGYFNPELVPDAKSPPALIIDNGSHTCRAGFSKFDTPSIIFPNQLARIKKTLDGVPYELVGNELDQKELYRYYIKNPFDNDVVVNFDIQETILDYIFYNMDQENKSKLKFPVIMTETLCNPSYSRRCMLQLLFELYKVPSVSFGVDSLFSFNSMFEGDKVIPDDGLIVSLSHSCSHIIPRLNGRFQIEKAIRLRTGGKSLHAHWNNLLSFTNPYTVGSLYQNRIQEIVDRFSIVAENYFEKVDEVYQKAREDPDYGTFIQFPIVSGNLENSNRVEMIVGDRSGRKDEALLKLYAVHNSNRIKKIEKYREELEQYEALNESGLEVTDDIEKRKALLNSRIETLQSKYDKVLDVLNGKLSIEEIRIKKKVLSPEQVIELQNERKRIIERKRKRQKFKEENTGRKKQATRNRMKILTSLAANEREDKINKKLRNQLMKQEEKFGLEESDWDIYRSVAVQRGFDGESEEEDMEMLTRIENQLIKAGERIDPDHDEMLNSKIEDYSKFRVTTESYRVTEALFRPHMIGMRSVPGIVDGLIKVLNKFSYDEQMRMSQNIHFCGGLMKIPGMIERLEKELLSIRPFKSEFKVRCPDDLRMDSWVGARMWYNSLSKEDEKNHFAKYSDYEEEGIDRVLEKLKDFSFSNIFNES